jgi:cyclopropane fatty-acyl-phospholipid synthase-like methyltransferase
MPDIINSEGDRFLVTQQGRGVDISSQRMDELDQASITHIQHLNHEGNSPVQVIDLGGGFGVHSIRMAQAGAQVTFIDVDCNTARAKFEAAATEGLIPSDSITLHEIDFKDIRKNILPPACSILYSQRALHYIRYDEAQTLLTTLFNTMTWEGKLFLSVAGYDTEYGLTFPDRDKPIQNRYSMVTTDMQEKHGILHPIVTYTENELHDLVDSVGFTVDSLTSSHFGNIKLIARKRNLPIPPSSAI